MTYLTNRKCDVFVSYATANNVAPKPWVTALRDAVQRRVDEALGRRGICDVWMDKRLRGNEPFDEQLRSQVSGSGVLLVVLSRAYLQSAWCLRELEIFAESAGTDSWGPHGRIFLVHYEPTPADSWPPQLEGLSSAKYRFFEQPLPHDVAIPIKPAKEPPSLYELREELADKLRNMVVELHKSRPAHTTRDLSDDELVAREIYLRELRKDIEEKLAASIHRARFIDLDIADTPEATRLPWRYKNPYSDESFANIDEALDRSGRRLLLLGHPGAGKTTTLLHITLRLIGEAETDPQAPIPLLVNLSGFRFIREESGANVQRFWLLRMPTRPNSSQYHLEDWLADEFSVYPGLSRRLANRWLSDGRVAALLDGLDEVVDTRRAELARLINKTLLLNHPNSPVVVCSRIYEYQPLQEDESSRLQLPGAVTLQPLSKTQIEEYLKQAEAGELQKALVMDSELEKMAATPLMLSMMTLAYAGLSAEEIPSDDSLTERRHRLMETYADRMLQRHERRRRNLPLDDHPRNDVSVSKYKYPPNKVNRYLGWLAVRLSTRMRTSCSLDSLYALLRHGLDAKRQKFDAWVTNIALSLLLLLCLLFWAVTTATMFQGATYSILIVVVVSGLLPVARSLEVTDHPLLNLCLAAFIYVVVGLGLAAISLSLSAAMPFTVSPFPTGLIAVGTVIALIGVLLIVLGNRDVKLYWLVGVTFSALVVGLLVPQWTDAYLGKDVLVAALMVTTQGILGAYGLYHNENSVAAVMIAAIFLVGLAGVDALGLILLSQHQDLLTIFTISAAALLLFSAEPDAWAALIGLVVSSTLGVTLGGHDGAILAATAFGLVALFCGVTESETSWSGWSKLMLSLPSTVTETVDRWWLSPNLRWLIAVSGHLPFRCRRFVRYCHRSLLLKHSSHNLEFVHRMLRDYFALRDLRPQLQSSDLNQRFEAIQALGYQGVSAVDTLGELAAHSDVDVRLAAVMSLGRISAPETVEHLEGTIRDGDPEVRRTTILNLGNVSAYDMQRLLKLVEKDDDPVVQFTRMDADDRRFNYELREEIFNQVLGIARRDGPNRLIAALGHQDAAIPRHAADALGRLGDMDAVEPLILALNNQHGADEATEALGKLGDAKAVEPIVQACLKGAVRRSNAGRVLSQLDAERAGDLLIQALKDRDAEVRARVAEALGQLSNKRAVEPLITALKDRDATVRGRAAAALGQLSDKRAVDPLITALKDRGAEVRASAVKALGQLSDKRAADPLITALKDRDAEVRASAATALRQLRDQDTVVPLIIGLKDRNAKVRASAAEALGQLGDKRAVDPLITALKDRGPGVRDNAAEALGQLGDKRAVEPLMLALKDKYDFLRQTAARALGQLGDSRAVEPLLLALKDKDDFLRQAAAGALGQLGDPRAVEPLLLALKDKDDFLRRAAARALGQLGDPRAVEPLILILKDENTSTRSAAAQALGRLGDPRAVDPLILILQDEDVFLQYTAMHALDELGHGHGLEWDDPSEGLV